MHGQGSPPSAIILFDGVCNLCNALVNFVIDRDPRSYFRFGALQSDRGCALLRAYRISTQDLRTLVLIEDGGAHVESTAVLRIVRRLNGLWPVLYLLIVIPRRLRDPLYRLIARHRYRWFGRRDQCRLPEPSIQDRFLS